MSTDDKLMTARCRIQISEPWYGAFSSQFNWIEEESIKTVGVCITSNGKVNCYYNKEWTNSLSADELIAVILHEIEHIIRMHCQRTPPDKPRIEKLIYNIAQDWAINGFRNNKNIKNLPDCGEFMPHPHNQIDILRWPDTDLSFFLNDHSSEEIYDWLKNNIKYKEVDLENIKLHDDHDVWDNSNATHEEIRQTIRDLAKHATSCAGSAPGSLITHLKKLESPEINWTHKLKNATGRIVGKRRSTYSRANRRIKKFGVKGTSSHGSCPMTILVDTSASMSDRMVEKVFAEIEAISQYFKITLIQFDYNVQSIERYHKGDWKKINIKGRGGTSIPNALKYIEENNLIGQINIILTDGESALPNKKLYEVIWVIIGKSRANTFKKNITFGEVIEINDITN